MEDAAHLTADFMWRSIVDCGPFDPFSFQQDFCAFVQPCPTAIEDDELHEPDRAPRLATWSSNRSS